MASYKKELSIFLHLIELLLIMCILEPFIICLINILTCDVTIKSSAIHSHNHVYGKRQTFTVIEV